MKDSVNDDQPCSSDSAATDHDFSFYVELPEDDPEFEKKKKLLQQKGFTSKELIYVKCSCDDWMNTTLARLLQRVRIIQLNEMELFFGEMEIKRPEEFFSPRNELESLNFVLSLIDNTLLECTSGVKVFLQDLRAATVQKIVELGELSETPTRILENSCVNEKQLLEWAASNGIKSKLQIAYVEGAGRGAVAVEDLQVGEVALEIPASAIISEDVVYESNMYPILENIEDITTETMLLLWSMRERHDPGSKYKIYFHSLPKSFNTGLSFGTRAIMVLQGTLVLQEILQAKEHLRSQYDKMFPDLCDRYPDVFPPQFYSWKQYLWACELWYSNSMKVMSTDGRLKTCLIPVAGLLNHSIYPHVLHYGKLDSETSALKFPLSRPCKAGEQCFLSYGNLSSSHLLTFYGFLPRDDNPNDIIPLDLEDELASDNHAHMVRGTWLAKNHELFFYGLPAPLLDALRKLRNPGFETVTPVMLENDIEVLDSLQDIFGSMMDGFGDEDSEDRESTDWDVILAVEFKDLQRRIVSSILTSCHAGRNMIEHSLLKQSEEEIRAAGD